MTIILTKIIAGKEVKLDLISLDGTVIRAKNFEELKKKGITKVDLKEAGFGVEPVSVKPVEVEI